MATTATRFAAASDRANYAGTSGSPPAPSAGWSASWWAYISVDSNDFATMLRLHTSSGGSTVLNLAMAASGTAPGAFTAGGSVQIGTELTVAAWYYLAYTVSGTTLTIYVFDASGALVTSTSGTIGGGAPDGLTVGGRSIGDSTEWFNGRLSRMRMWSAVLSQAQFAAEQFAANPVTTANLWEHWPLTGAGDLTGAIGGHNLVAGTTATTTEAGPPLPEGVSGSATAALGGLGVTAAGRRTALGQASVTLSAPVAFTTGVREVRGAATAAMPALGASVIASRMVHGVATVGLAPLAASVVGRRRVAGVVAVGLGGAVATVTGRRAVRGSATATLGRLIAVVIIADDHDVAVRARLTSQNRIRAQLGTRRVRSALGAQR